ncbi:MULTISPECIES: type II toxin-antitoxin system HicB family antitoxin [Vagococcus]|uniref:HicB-like antitoxin of toxin-antitoxin system domain-containing protein n=1 Tax=Vagococcus fluvialis bH819 TaxID=1255619 RepID=A0A1X8XKV8_9ENTE|nr:MULTISPECIES: hypothetical protein [Vagococcus]SLM84458.1 hypothetical protein FM121_00095 [Vagococcus fluvialis bH819]HCM90497.1 hypothetical protein [Vagococcus sp.]
MLISYPAIFYYEDNSSSVPFQIYFPDLDGLTQGINIPDAIAMGSEYLGIRLADDFENKRELPKPSNINELSLTHNAPFQDDDDFNFMFDPEKSFISMVNVNLIEYLGLEEPIKKTLAIPKWADKLGKELHLNFSKTLTEAIIKEKLNH